MRNEFTIQLAGSFQRAAETKLTAGTAITGPWDRNITPLLRAQIHLDLLSKTYGAGHPGSAEPTESLMERQMRGEMLTWFISLHGTPVGMANLEIKPIGIAEMCRTLEIPVGTELPDSTQYDGRVKTSAVAYQRLADALSHDDIGGRTWALEADLRMAKPITLPNGKTLEGGVRTQHINHILKPMLLHVPRFQVHPPQGKPHQEVFLQSREYLQPDRVLHDEPIYTPEMIGAYNGVTIADIVGTTYPHAFASEPNIVNGSRPHTSNASNECRLETTAGEHYSTLLLSGNPGQDHILRSIKQGLTDSRFLELVIPNLPGNIELQHRLYALGLVPLGVMTGGTFKVNGDEIIIPTTIHFGAVRPSVVPRMVDIELAREFDNSSIKRIVLSLHDQWQLWEDRFADLTS